MATKHHQKKDKQKSDLLFKYMKSIDSFRGGGGNQEQSKHQLEKFFRRAVLEGKEQVMALSSRVYSLSIGDSKTKKRVKFSDEVTVGKASSGTKKDSNTNGSNISQPQPNPQQITRDLLDLQRSTFAAFKIASSPPGHSISSSVHNLPSSQSLLLESKLETRETTQGYQNNNSIARDIQTRHHISRSKSEFLISNQAKSRIQREASGQRVKDSEPSNQSTSRNNAVLSRAGSQSGLSRGISAVSYHKERPGLISKSSSPLVRSQSFWRQENNLMVQIFKSKLLSKVGR